MYDLFNTPRKESYGVKPGSNSADGGVQFLAFLRSQRGAFAAVTRALWNAYKAPALHIQSLSRIERRSRPRLTEDKFQEKKR